MARAKRTDRNEARRRYRVAQADRTELEPGEPPTPNTLSNDATGKSRPAGPPVRPSVSAAFRGSFRPMDLRGDLQALPLIVTHWAVLVSIAVSVVATVLFITSTNELGSSLDLSLAKPLDGKSFGQVSNLSLLVLGLFVTPPPAAGAFLIGFTAVRASWLGGLIQGIVAGVCYTAILLSPAGRTLTLSDNNSGFIATTVILAPVGAMLFAASAAWYRRFLNMANPNRGRRPERPTGRQKARPASARTSPRR